MSENNNEFVQLCKKLTEFDLFGDGPLAPPWNDPPTLESIQAAIFSGTPFLPKEYRDGYVMPLLESLPSLTGLGREDFEIVETLVGSIYDHASGSVVKPEIERFLAVISNLYRSFLSKAKRAAIDVPFTSTLPPLAVFQHSGKYGPFTIPSDEVNNLTGSKIGVVSLPSTYRDHPLLWASLAHETGGHDVTHADEGLLPELADEIKALFGASSLQPDRSPTSRQQAGLLWSYWIDEAAADVYGLLNIGPAFALNLAALFATLNNLENDSPLPTLNSSSGPMSDGRALDPHPTQILRLHLAIGVIENLINLSPPTAQEYITRLERLAQQCAQGATTIDLEGWIAIERDHWIHIDPRWPLAEMQEQARRVGASIATARLQSIANHSIQEIETWDDADEQTAQQIKSELQNNKSVLNLGDDAQLLAGATLALSERPDQYEAVTKLLEEALDQSFEQDPIWKSPLRHLVFISNRKKREREYSLAAD